MPFHFFRFTLGIKNGPKFERDIYCRVQFPRRIFTTRDHSIVIVYLTIRKGKSNMRRRGEKKRRGEKGRKAVATVKYDI